MFANLIYWAFDRLDNLGGWALERISPVISAADAFTDLLIKVLIIELAIIGFALFFVTLA